MVTWGARVWRRGSRVMLAYFAVIGCVNSARVDVAGGGTTARRYRFKVGRLCIRNLNEKAS